MKKILIFGWIVLALGVSAQENCQVADQKPLLLMQEEMKRGFKVLKKQKPPIYYLSYIYREGQEQGLTVSYAGVAEETEGPFSTLEVQARAGSVKMDNTRALRAERENWNVSASDVVPSISAADKKPFLTLLWQQTQKAAEKAQEEFSRVQNNVRNMAVNKDQSDDFVFPPVSTFCQEEALQKIDLQKVKEILVEVSKLPSGHDEVIHSQFSFSAVQGHRYFLDSLGTRIKTPFSYIRLNYTLSGKGLDGLEIERFGDYNLRTMADFPSLEKLTKDVKKSLEEIKALSQAPEGKPDNVPVLLKGRAAAVFAHEVMGHRLEGDDQKNAASGQTLAGKMGQQVISPLITITAEPTLREFKQEPLRGYYEYDDEGVKARKVVLIEKGILKNFMMKSSPIEGFSYSNGHGRKEVGFRAAARMSVLRVSAEETVPYAQLEQMLLEEIKQQGKTHGFIVEDLGGGYTFTDSRMPQSFKLQTKLVYKVFPDGSKQVVRGLDVVGTPLVSFSRVIAVGDDDVVFNGSCGSVSGWVPQSNISPSLLFKSMELQKTEKSDFKPPVLPAPKTKKEKK